MSRVVAQLPQSCRDVENTVTATSPRGLRDILYVDLKKSQQKSNRDPPNLSLRELRRLESTPGRQLVSKSVR